MKLLILFTLFLFQNSVHAKLSGPKRYDYKGFAGYVSTDLYYATQGFDNNGKEFQLPSSGKFMLADFPFGARYILGDRIGVEAVLKASFAQSESSQPIDGGTRTNSQLSEFRASMDYLFETNAFDLIPEIEVIVPFTDISSDSDEVPVSEGVQSIIGRMHFQMEFGKADFFSSIGFESRDKGRANLMPWSLGLGWQAQSSFWGARVFGSQSISDDEDKDTPVLRNAYISRVSAGAARFYSVNPNVISAELLTNFKLSPKWEMQLRGGLDVAGENYSKGFFAGATLVLDFGHQDAPTRRRRRQTKEIQEQIRTGIAVDPDAAEFKEQKTEVEKEQQYFEPPRPKPKPKRKTRGSKQISEDAVQDELDDAELQIEMKRRRDP